MPICLVILHSMKKEDLFALSGSLGNPASKQNPACSSWREPTVLSFHEVEVYQFDTKLTLEAYVDRTVVKTEVRSV